MIILDLSVRILFQKCRMRPSNKNEFRALNPWEKFKQGDYSILGEIFEAHYQELYFYGLKLVHVQDLVKDTIQDVFTDIWSRRTQMGEVLNIKAYLFVSLRHELLRRIGKLRKESGFENIVNEPFIFSVEEFIVKEEDGSEITLLLLKSLRQLTERQREIILLRFNHEMEFQDMATILNMNVQSVRNLLFRALENIRKDMKSAGIKGHPDVEMFLFSLFQKKK